MKFVLCVPVHNEEAVINRTLEAIHSFFLRTLGKLTWSILVIDNGSTDHTKKIVSDSRLTNVRIISIPEKGKGSAIFEAVRKVDADIICITDADLPVHLEDIVKMTESIVTHKCNLVVGSRRHPETVSDRDVVRSINSRIFNLLARIITGVKNTDTQCPAKVFDRHAASILLECKERGWFLDLEFVRRAELSGLSVAEVPVHWQERVYKNRKSKVNIVRDGLGAISAMFRIRRDLWSSFSKGKPFYP